MQTRAHVRMARARILAAALAAAALAPEAAQAQRHGGHTHDEERYDAMHYDDRHGPRWELGAGFAVMAPRGQFESFVDDGYGVALNATMGLDPSNVVGLRFELGYINYGSERFGVPVFPTSGRMTLKATWRLRSVSSAQ